VVRKAVSGEDVLLGDAEFDAGAHVEGPEDQVLAALREPARRAVLPLLTGHRATVKDGVLRVELHGVVDGELVRRMLAGMAETARALCVASVPEALADGARVDPNPEVRLRSLQVLLRTWREHEAAKRAAHAAIIDANPRARLAAARLLADEQAAVALRQLADDATVPAEVRVGALETLLELRPDFLAEALRGWAADEELAETAARAFGTLGDSRAEPVLLGLLSHPRPAAREAAVLSLGQVGTIRAVEPLTALAASGPLRAAAREAIRRVQARLGDAEAGRLSVAPERGAAGAVSLPAEVRVGALETLLELRPDFLAEALRGWAADEELAETAARAFGTLGDSRAEPVLLDLLSHPRPAAREAAVLSLGQVGTIRAVEPLTALAAAGPLRAAAREAIRRVQARLGDAEAGRLSVAPERGATGAVSLPAEAEADPTCPERVKG
jgi:HEAT repeat protein